MARRKKPADVRALKEELSAVDAKIAELREKRDRLKKDQDEAERIEVLNIVTGAGISAEILRLIIAEYQSEPADGGAPEEDAPEKIIIAPTNDGADGGGGKTPETGVKNKEEKNDEIL
jgi:hypothetical protein